MLSTWDATYGKEGACKTLGCQWIPRSLWTPDATHLVSSAEVVPTGGTLKISTWRDVPLLSFQEEEKENLFSGCRALQGLVGIWENQSFWKEIKQDSQVSGIIALSPGSLLPNDPREESVQWKAGSLSKENSLLGHQERSHSRGRQKGAEETPGNMDNNSSPPRHLSSGALKAIYHHPINFLNIHYAISPTPQRCHYRSFMSQATKRLVGWLKATKQL